MYTRSCGAVRLGFRCVLCGKPVPFAKTANVAFIEVPVMKTFGDHHEELLSYSSCKWMAFRRCRRLASRCVLEGA
jgi:hypothetical protein